MAYIDPLEGVSVFAAVVEAESFSGAARTLRCSKAAVSTQIRKLEDRLGVRLLNRTTRRVSLTGEGRAYFEHARRMLDEAREATDAIDSLDAEPRGLLRVNAPMSFGILHLGPALTEFIKAHTKVEVELNLNDRRIDLIEEGFDLAVRIARLADSTLIARRLAPCRRVIVAAPDYWKRHGRPTSPEDLRNHEALIYEHMENPDTWRFKGPGGAISVAVRGRYRANNGEVLMEAAKAGLGVCLEPTFLCCRDLQRGELEIALENFEDDAISVYAVYPHRRHLSTRVRALVDFLVEHFGDPPYWDAWAG